MTFGFSSPMTFGFNSPMTFGFNSPMPVISSCEARDQEQYLSFVSFS
jgi:hypothetical protein